MIENTPNPRLARRYREVMELVAGASLFQRPGGLEGHSYQKPLEYLTIALIGFNNDEVRARLDVALAGECSCFNFICSLGRLDSNVVIGKKTRWAHIE